MPTRWPCVLILVAGCGSDFPDGGGNAQALFPLAVGARWEYLDRNLAAEPRTKWKEITECVEVTFEDCSSGEPRDHDVFVQVTTMERGGVLDDDDQRQYMEVTSDGIVRVKQDFYQTDKGGDLVPDHYVTYSPYFMRLFSGPYGAGREETFDHERCEFELSGAPRNFTTRHYRHTVLEKREVTVPYGTVEAVGIERVDLLDGDTKRYWYVEEVGKVLEEEILEGGGLGDTEELVSFTPGEGSCP